MLLSVLNSLGRGSQMNPTLASMVDDQLVFSSHTLLSQWFCWTSSGTYPLLAALSSHPRLRHCPALL